MMGVCLYPFLQKAFYNVVGLDAGAEGLGIS